MRISKETFAKRVRVGFELETQESEGASYYEDVESLLDSAYTEVDKAVSKGSWPKLLNAPKAVADWLAKHEISIASETVNRLANKVAAKSITKKLGPKFEFGELIEIGEDGSVDGFEFRTVGPNTVTKALKAIRKLFKLNHTVDTGCSFHIHVSLLGRFNGYSRQTQARLVNGVVSRLSMLPDSVIERFNSTAIQQWAHPSLGEYKGKFVSYRGKTWEFRCFGNVSSENEAKACLTVALESFRDAVNGRGSDCLNTNEIMEALKTEYQKRFNKVNRAA